MSIKPKQLYLAVCDGCDESVEDRDDTDFAYGATREEAEEIARGVMWVRRGRRLLCPDCALGGEDG